MWKAHPEEQRAVTAKGRETSLKARTQKTARQRDRTGGGTGERTGGVVATAVASSPAAVVFVLGQERIELDPKDLYESYLLYQHLISELGFEQSFSSVLKDAVSAVSLILIPQGDANGGNKSPNQKKPAIRFKL